MGHGTVGWEKYLMVGYAQRVFAVEVFQYSPQGSVSCGDFFVAVFALGYCAYSQSPARTVGCGTFGVDVVARDHDGSDTRLTAFDDSVLYFGTNRIDHAAKPDKATALYEYFSSQLKENGVKKVENGVFGADMAVEISNDGPVTIIMDTAIWRKG